MNWKKSETKRAALVLQHEKRQRNISTMIITAFALICNTASCALIGWSFAYLVFGKIIMAILSFCAGAALAAIAEVADEQT